jgi:hypothetical protein
MQPIRFKPALLGAALLAASAARNAGAVTIDAGDYTRLPDGTNLAVLYLQHFKGTDLYANGKRASGNAELTADVGILRGVRFIDVGPMTIVPQFLLPFGRIRTCGDLAGLESENGVGDLILAPTFHFIQDPSRKRSFAATTWLYLPTGNYDRNKAINALGENRWKLALQLGYITPLSDKWTLDLIGDVTFYGDNDEFGPAGATLKQKTSYEGQLHLRYNLGAATYLAGMVSHAWGGETEVDGVDQNDRQRRSKALVSVGHFVAPTWQLLGSWGRDLSVRQGVKEDNRFNLRILKVF